MNDDDRMLRAIYTIEGILLEATEIDYIRGFAKCPGVPVFDIETLPGDWIQIEVKICSQ